MTWALIFAVTAIVLGLLSNVVATWVEPGLKRFKRLIIAIFVCLALVSGIFFEKDGPAFPTNSNQKQSKESNIQVENGASRPAVVDRGPSPELLAAWQWRLREEGVLAGKILESNQRVSNDLSAMRAELAAWATRSEATARALPYFDRGDYNAAIQILREASSTNTVVVPSTPVQHDIKTATATSEKHRAPVVITVPPPEARLLSDGEATCPSFNLFISLVSLKRLDAGRLTLILEFENGSNFNLKPFQPDYGRGTLLMDDQGDAWRMVGMGGSVYNGRILLPGVKTKLTYKFTKMSGGNEETKATARILLSLSSLDMGGPSGKCEFTLKNLPIS